MPKSISERDLDKVKILGEYFSENDMRVSDIVDKISEMAGVEVSESDIEGLLGDSSVMGAQDGRIEVVVAILEFLYDRNYIEKPDCIDEHEGEDFEVSPSASSNKKVGGSVVPERRGDGLSLSILVGVLLFGCYAFYMDYREDAVLRSDLEQRNSEVKDLRLEILSLKEKIAKIKNENVSLSERNTRLREKIVEEARGAGQHPVIKKSPPKSLPHPPERPVETPDLQRLGSDLQETKVMGDRLARLGAAEERSIAEAKKSLSAANSLELSGVEKDERKVLEGSLGVHKTDGGFVSKEVPYRLDEGLKERFLKGCFSHYEYRKTEYRAYCLCLAEKAVEGEVDFLDMLKLLSRHKIRGEYPNFSYIGSIDNPRSLTFTEYRAEKRGSQCYHEYIERASRPDLKLNY